jgi:hypothetical protein
MMQAGGRAPALYGDVGEKLNTDLNADRSGPATGKDQVQAAGLDYNTSVYTTPDGTKVKNFVEQDKVHRLEGTIDADIASKAEVCLGAGVYARAQQRAADLEAARAASAGAAPEDQVFVPKMLRTSATEDSGDSLPGIMRRTRGDAAGNTVKNPDGSETLRPEIDPRSGLGYSVSERLGMDVVPNQERKMREAVPLAGHVPDATITRSDTHAPMLQLAPDGKTMVPVAGLSAADEAYYRDPNFGKNVT